MRQGDFPMIQYYMSTVVDGLVSFSKEVSYKMIHRPIWRGISS